MNLKEERKEFSDFREKYDKITLENVCNITLMIRSTENRNVICMSYKCNQSTVNESFMAYYTILNRGFSHFYWKITVKWETCNKYYEFALMEHGI